MHLKARLSNLKVSPRKTRFVIDLVRGKSIAEAERILTFTPKISAAPILKLLRSAVANVERGTEMKKEQLFIRSITATPGVTLKRYHPRAHGRAMMIRKRWTNVLVELGSRSDQTSEPKKRKATSKSASKESKTLSVEIKTVTDVREVKKLTAKAPLLRNEQASTEESKQSGTGHVEKPQFNQRKTGGE